MTVPASDSGRALGLGARIAAIDIGTNTVLLTVAERVTGGGDLAGRLQVILERHAITRLGQGVDRTRKLDPEAAARTLDCLALYATEMQGLGVQEVLCVGTSALRDAAEGASFVARANEILGCSLQVVTGAREAELTFRGALSSLTERSAEQDLVLAFDIGGGSTEIVLGTSSGLVRNAVSVDVGSVRLLERHGRDPWLDVVRTVRAALPPSFGVRPSVVVGIAGTMTTLWSVVHGTSFDEAAARERPIEAGTISRLATELHAMPVEQRRAHLGIDAGRADVIPYGALIASQISDWLGASVVHVTGRGVRYGLLLEALD